MLWETIRKKAVVVHPVSIRVSHAGGAYSKGLTCHPAYPLEVWQFYTPGSILRQSGRLTWLALCILRSQQAVLGCMSWPIQAPNTATCRLSGCRQMHDSC